MAEFDKKWKNVGKISDKQREDIADKESKTVSESSNVNLYANQTMHAPTYAEDGLVSAATDGYQKAVDSVKRNELIEVTQSFPLMDRGLAGPEFALGAIDKSGDMTIPLDHNKDDQPREDFRLWKKFLDSFGNINPTTYKGLDRVLVGDIIIYDEEITYKDGTIEIDAGYPRHVAYVEKVNRQPECKNGAEKVAGVCLLGANPNPGQPQSILVSEMNWGKNLDSCGNTDTWGIKTYRTIVRPEELVKPIKQRKQNYASCQNADWAMCEEKYWDRIKIYRPVKVEEDTSKAGMPKYTPDPAFPVCKNVSGVGELPTPITLDKIISSGLVYKDATIANKNVTTENATAYTKISYSAKEVIQDYDAGVVSGNDTVSGNKWYTMITSGYGDIYDLRLVNNYMKKISEKMDIGTCDPDPMMREDIKNGKIWFDYRSAKTYLGTL